MGNIDISIIRKKNFEEGSRERLVEDYCRKMASQHTDGLIKRYNELLESRDGVYINSDLMKMVFPFYANSIENRKLYNLSITNSAATLANEAYRRAILNPDIKRCIFLTGPYGAGKSFFAQSLFENEKEKIIQNSIIYEGSITPPAFDEKIDYALKNGVTPEIIALNPTLELSMRNIRERKRRIGRDVIKSEVIDKFSNYYIYFKELIKKYKGIPFIIYNKESNIPIDLDAGSKNIEDLNHGTSEEISIEYDRIKEMLCLEEKKIQGNRSDFTGDDYGNR